MAILCTGRHALALRVRPGGCPSTHLAAFSNSFVVAKSSFQVPVQVQGRSACRKNRDILVVIGPKKFRRSSSRTHSALAAPFFAHR